MHKTRTRPEWEERWQHIWEQHKVYETPHKPKDGVYVLDMFPYPSAQGLHVGHPEGYTASDIYARYLRHKGRDVLHPMGFDSFGLPAENYAIKTGTHPAKTTAENIENMRRQIKSLGFSYDWDREVITSDPAYYKWTQVIFVKLFEAGLAYEADAPINWCPKDKTGLANEEVVNGKCERCGTEVTKKKIKQWLVKITDEKYIDRLLNDLDDLDWPENIKEMQRNWIGKSEGAEVDFEIKDSKEKITVFTTRPDTLFGATYMVLSPEHALVDQITKDEQKEKVQNYKKQAAAKSDLERTELAKEKTGEFTGSFAINPVNGKEIPIWIADYVLASYGTGAIMAVPAHDQRDYEFAKKFDLDIIEVVDSKEKENGIAYTGEGVAMNSGEFDGLSTQEFKKKIIAWFNTQADKSKKNALIVHGLSGHKRENWFPWLKKELEKSNWKVAVPTMPGAGHPTLESWEAELRKHNNIVNEHAVLVGHSLGCASILYYLQNTGQEVDTVILVAPTNPLQHWEQLKETHPSADWDAVARMNQEKMYDWKKIRGLARRFILLYSDNDPYVHSESIDYYKKNLPEAEFHLFKGMSHFSESTAGITEFPEILDFVPQFTMARASVSYKMRDWLFSRQRYWGEPIPIVHCETCGNVGVPEKDLPLELPDVEKYEPTGTGESPLANIDEWVNTTCPNCKGKAKRETNTMPQWAGSNWYFLRYTDPNNEKTLADKKKIKEWMPVEMYIGGAEHAVLHLLYARFIYKFLFDIKVIPKECGDEPFTTLKNQGLILGEDMQKMSKSRGNVVNPDDVINEYGADVMRMYEMFMGPFEDAKPWSMQGMIGIKRFLDRVKKVFDSIINNKNRKEILISNSIHGAVKKVGEDIINFKFNTAISELMTFFNSRSWAYKLNASGELEGNEVDLDAMKKVLILLSPFAPHLAEELWQKLHGRTEKEFTKENSITTQPWPEFDESKLQEDTFTLVVMINGKKRDEIELAKDVKEKDVREKVFESEKVKKWTDGKQIKMEKYITEKIYTIVVQ